jgi:hypothetical protein
MAKLVYGMNQSLDGYVDHLEFRPSQSANSILIFRKRNGDVSCK